MCTQYADTWRTKSAKIVRTSWARKFRRRQSVPSVVWREITKASTAPGVIWYNESKARMGSCRACCSKERCRVQPIQNQSTAMIRAPGCYCWHATSKHQNKVGKINQKLHLCWSPFSRKASQVWRSRLHRYFGFMRRLTPMGTCRRIWIRLLGQELRIIRLH